MELQRKKRPHVNIENYTMFIIEDFKVAKFAKDFFAILNKACLKISPISNQLKTCDSLCLRFNDHYTNVNVFKILLFFILVFVEYIGNHCNMLKMLLLTYLFDNYKKLLFRDF